MTAPVALVTGANGQDGSYLVEALAAQGYDVHALVRSADRMGGVPDVGATIHVQDLRDHQGLHDLVQRISPDQIHNLAGVSSVARSWGEPLATAASIGTAVLALLDAAWTVQEKRGREVRFVQASSAEIFGEPESSPQDEQTRIQPVSPYGASKAFAQHCVDVYRGRGLPASSLILYNHESPRRPRTFVTRKITQAVARIAQGGTAPLVLGNLDAARDWGWAPDYVEAFQRAAHCAPGDYVIATGVAHTVRDFVVAAFDRAGIEDWERWVEIDPDLLRPTDPTILVGDPSAARAHLGWAPTLTFRQVVDAMVDADLAGEAERPG